MKNKTWLIGAGIMAIDYMKVLEKVSKDYIVIGRGEKSAQNFKKITGKDVVVGGIENFLKTSPELPEYAIVAVNVDMLKYTTEILIKAGIKNILLEKPGGIDKEEIINLNQFNKDYNSNIYIAYNRRFYASAIKAKEIIKNDGGVTSFNFEFTEWSHVIEKIDKKKEIKENWLLANSTHVIDLAFYLGGKPKEIKAFTTGSLDWHKKSSIFSGAGISEKGALFSYQANWESAGRWSVEILTEKHRLIFRPMEKLQIQNRGEIAINFVDDIDYILDTEYKPGLYKQVEAFFKKEKKEFIMLEEQSDMVEIYNIIGNY